LCALLHTVGKPVVLRLISDLEGGSRASLSEAEVDALIKEFHHMAASDVTLAWNLPEHVQVAAIYHEDPEQAPGYFTETKLTALSGKLAAWVDAGDSAEDIRTVGQWPEWEEFDFASSDIDEVIEHAGELRESAASMLA
jgi:HD-like signal output (HDOD) protein